MSKKTLWILIVVIIVAISVLIFWLWPSRVNDNGFDIGSGEYQILYGRSDNVITSAGSQIPVDMLPAQIEIPQSSCYQFTLYNFLGGGIIDREGGNNKVLGVSGNPMSYLYSKKLENYFYISTEQNPVSENFGVAVLDWEVAGQQVMRAPFSSEESEVVKGNESTQFPSGLKVSPGNKFLVYSWTTRSSQQFNTGQVDPFLSDSSLVIYDIADKQENVILDGQYNRALFTDFSDFSQDGKSLFTIRRQGDDFEFVRIDLASGDIKPFSEAFPGFDWDQVDWNEFFTQDGNFQPTRFAMSPDESMIIVYRSYTDIVDMAQMCSPDATHKLWAIDITGNDIKLYSESDNMIGGLSWNSNSEEFAFFDTTTGGCYPDYMDTHIHKMDRSGQNLETLVTYEKSKINSISWSPDGKEIAFGVYGTDLVGWIRSVDPETKEVSDVISTEETEGGVSQDRPVTLTFIDWVEK